MKRVQSMQTFHRLRVPRSEEIDGEQLSHYAHTLASVHRVSTPAAKKRTPVLLKRLDENVKIIKQAYEIIYDAVMTNRRVHSTDEWLMDNYYMVEEQIRLAKKHLPTGYSREMPQLMNGPVAGFPRVYGLILELINLVNGKLDEESIAIYIDAYQKMSTLHLGELWGIPIMLRLGLLENIRHVADEIIKRRQDCNAADEWADQLLAAASESSKKVIEVLSRMSQSIGDISNAFVIQMMTRLQGSDPLLSVITTWLQQQLSTQGLDVDYIYRVQRHSLKEDLDSMSNSIQSLRWVNTFEWFKFVEHHSKVEQFLRTDPSGTYSQQEFHTRDRCRHVIERLAKRNKVTEVEVAQMVVRCAEEQKLSFDTLYGSGTEFDADIGGGLLNNGRSGTADGHQQYHHHRVMSERQMRRKSEEFIKAVAYRKCHVSYWVLDDEGLLELQRKNGLKIGSFQKLYHNLDKLFFASMGIITLLYTYVTHRLLGSAVPLAVHFVLFPLLLISGSQLGVTLANRLLTRLARPRLPPRMDFSEGGIPDEHRTMIIVPTMLTSTHGVKELVQELLSRYLVNRDKNLYFALLTDFGDNATEHKAQDRELIDLAVKGIDELNAQYPPEPGSLSSTTFYLFHRKRFYNAAEGVWMGWERKRGKLTNFNSLLRGGPRDPYSHIVGDLSILSSIRYIITLDTDTMLPPDCAHMLVGNAAHILNMPVVDPSINRVVSGYGVLQPRVSVALTGAFRSLYARMNSLDSGLDPYTKEVSDVYQDVFGEGSFIGKGLYTVDQFEQVLGQRLPENRILSHDLLEGCYTRSGLVSDVEFFEEYPSSYIVDASRKHRWVRGDWQIASWLLPRVPSAAGAAAANMETNPLTIVQRWKILDNLRRSLVPLCMTAVMLIGWLCPASIMANRAAPSLLTMSILSIFMLPSLLNTFDEVLSKQPEISIDAHLRMAWQSFLFRMMDLATQILFLPFEAYNNVDASVRSLWRMHVSRINLLQWTTSTSAAAAYSRSNSRDQLKILFRQMWIEPTLGAVTLVLVVMQGLVTGENVSRQILNSWFVVGGWIVAPVVAWWLSKPIQPAHLLRTEEPLTVHDKRFLHGLSRRTWRYFETFGARPEDNYLPLDNFQEFPKPIYARRTSPTNIGIALLVNISALDFGYITARTVLDRVSNTLRSMQKMERYKGHFYNWYATDDLRPLPPRYVSSVDSGNLMAFLMILRVGLLDLVEAPVFDGKAINGIRDTMICLQDSLKTAERDLEELEDIAVGEERGGTSIDVIARQFRQIQQRIDDVNDNLKPSLLPKSFVHVLPWIEDMMEQVREMNTQIGSTVDQIIKELDMEDESVPADEDIAPENETREEKQVQWWAQAVEQQLKELDTEIREVAPWIALWPVPDQLVKFMDTITGGSQSTSDDADKAKTASGPSTGNNSNSSDAAAVVVIEFRKSVVERLEVPTKPNELIEEEENICDSIADMRALVQKRDANQTIVLHWLEQLSAAVKQGAKVARARNKAIHEQVGLVSEFIKMDYSFLYNSDRKLLHIGYNVDHNHTDSAFYDMLCSEARLTSYAAISLGQLPVNHWFSLGRLMTSFQRQPCLLSWSGSMFEYLLPLLVMPSFPGTLLDETYHSVVSRHIEYGNQRRVGLKKRTSFLSYF